MVPRILYLVVFSFVVTALSIPQDSVGQARIRGFVTDGSDGRPLQGVNVALLQNDQLITGAVTDGDGVFLISNIRPGSYRLQATFIGFETYSADVTLESRSFDVIRFTMHPASTEIEELVVEAERAGGATTTAGLQTIVPADIQRLPVPGVTGDLVGVLQSTPSVVSSGDRGGQLFIRGGEPTQNLILIDGIQLYQPFHILGFYSSFPAEIVNAADVHAGGFGARFGGRISSVLDIDSRNGNKRRFSGSASVSPFLSTAHLEGPLIRDYVSVLASIRESLIKDVVPDLYGQKLPYKFGDQFVKLHIQPTASVSLSATLLHSHDSGDIAGTRLTIRGDIDNTAIVDTSFVAWENLGVGGTLTLLPRTMPLRSDLTVSYSQYDTELGTVNDPERRAAVDGISVDQSVSIYSSIGEVNAGVFYNETNLAYSLTGAFQDVADEDTSVVTEAGAYGTLSLVLPGGTRVDGGVRFHTFPNQEKVTAEPRARVAVPFSIRDTKNTLSLAAGIYHQGLVGLSDERDAGNVFTVWTAVPDGRPLPRAVHAIAGWQITARPEPQTILKGSLEVYYKNLNNLSVPVWDAFPQFTTELQSANGSVAGVDARVEVTHGTFYGYIGAGRAETRYTAPDGKVFGAFYGEIQDDYSPPHDRKNQVNAVGRLDVGEVTLTAQWQYGSGLPYTQAVGFDDFILLQGDVDLLTDPGRTRVLYEAPYSSRLPDYHRLDLWLERSFKTPRVSGMIRAGVVNAYNRANLFYFDLFTLNRVEQLPAIPSIGAKLEF